MDLSNLQKIASNSATPDSILNAENPKIFTPKKASFFSFYYPQSFSLPNSIMFHICTNPFSQKGYLKIIQTCKYFFVKTPILIFSNVWWIGDGTIKRLDDYYNGEIWKAIDIKNMSFKIWITDIFKVIPPYIRKRMPVSLIIPKIYKCEVKIIYFMDQVLSIDDLSFLCSKVKKIEFVITIVKEKDGTITPLEKIIKYLPQIKNFYYGFHPEISALTTKTVEEIFNIQYFLKFESFSLSNIPVEFDIENFYT